ncbi:hypothetical protein AAHE18_14G168600 [Arachis hypogaea]
MCACVLSHDKINNKETVYLLQFREAIQNLPSNWFDNSTTICQWTGVVCGYTPQNFRFVEQIELNGPLPSFSGLSNLEQIFLSSNNFTSIPHGCFQGLESLALIDLGNNPKLPPWIFPTDLNNYSHLVSIGLPATNLMGFLPNTFDSFSILTLLYLSENNLTGVLPDNQKHNNKLSGTIQFLSSMPKLVEVNLEGNSIEGSIPDLSNSTSLQYLLLANNRLTGVVPPFLGLLNNISQVSLENNWLQGPLPAFNKSRAPKLNFTSNGFCLDHPGPCDHRVITLLQVAQTLYYPFLLAQSWRGNNPCQDWNFITCDDKGNIRTVNLTNLNLTGTISLSFKNLTVLEGLYLGGNRLNGSILDILTSLRQLKILDVSNNNLSGSLPPFSKKKTIVITTGNAFLQQSHSPKTSLSSTFIIEVEQMTNSFQEELGKGGFGIVYKGSLNDGCQLAVKILKEMKGSAEKFVNEVVTISRTSHVNIVSLLEFCYEMNKQALIYEFMSKGSLDKYKCKEGSSELDWKTLLQIVTGVAQGLDYLHRGCNTRILHFDIKPQNMLLDEKFCPKIADFGLARICKKDESVVSILDRRGISGYISPEMFSQRNGRVSHKSDVYSYGMLILEMIGGNDNYDIGESHSTEYFSDWILKDIKEDKIRLLRFASGKDDEDIIKKILFVGLWCIQMNPSDRPKMCKVVEMLQGKLESISLESIISSPTVPLLQHSDASHS